MTDQWIVIPRWDEFQHRDAARANVPTWVKTFTRLLSDDDYLNLTGHRRAILHGLWLEYARSRRQLRDDTRTLTHRLHLKVTTADLEALNHAGFIGVSASRPASNDASGSASTEKKREEGPPNPPEGGPATTSRKTRTRARTQPAGEACPHCNVVPPGGTTIAEHLENVHGLYTNHTEPAFDDSEEPTALDLEYLHANNGHEPDPPVVGSRAGAQESVRESQ